MGFGAWLLEEIAAHEMDRPSFIERVGFSKGTVSRWINDEAVPSPPAVVEIARALRLPPVVVLYRAAGLTEDAARIDYPTINLPPRMTRDEAQLVEHLAWSVRHWREGQEGSTREENRDDPNLVA
jgi:transcriptional regulator with XRE-family HTH domain